MDPVLIRLRSLLDPQIVLDAKAKEGTAFLSSLDDQLLLRVARLVILDKSTQGAVDLLQSAGVDADQESLIQALRRLMMLGRSLSSELVGDATPTVRQDAPPEMLLFCPGTPFEDVMAECSKAAKDHDVVKDLSVLVAVQKRRLTGMLKETSGLPTSFMQADKINASIDSLRRSLECLLKAQLETGLIEKSPEKLDVRLQGALQTYLGGMDTEVRGQLVKFGESFIDMGKEYYGS